MARSTPAHRLDPLLRPASIAVVGASESPGSVGADTMDNLLTGGYDGVLYPVNPGREQVRGIDCFPDLASLPATVDLVIFAISDARIESGLRAAIEHGAAAAVIMSTLILPDDEDPPLRERIARLVAESGILLCGANGMGFYNFADGVWACGFDTRPTHVRGGNVTLISHSGSGMSGIIDCEERIDFNLAVSTGQELCVGMAEYMDFALEQAETRVIGLFMEAARQPAALIAALKKANERGVPVVAIKVGRTDLSARLAVSHSGAIAGTDSAYDALFDRYGVQRVEDMDELAHALMMFAQPHDVGEGGLVSIHDSGGERQLLIDLADRAGVPLTGLLPATAAKLESMLDPGLPAVNPLDAWSTGGPGADRVMAESLAAMMADPGAAVGAVVHDRAPLGRLYPAYFDYMRTAHAMTGKPVFLVSNRQGSGSDPEAVNVTREGFPVLDGLRSFLTGVRCLFAYRDFRARPPMTAGAPDPDLVDRCLARLSPGGALDEFESGEMLSAFGLPTGGAVRIGDERDLMRAADSMGYPVVLKTAAPGVLHKSDVGGVMLDIDGPERLAEAYRELSARLGPSALVAPMAGAGAELMLGMVQDQQFGPMVVLGFGGIDVEVLDQTRCALPPFDAATARRLLDGLPLRRLLDGGRGRPAPDLDAFCTAAARFSEMVAALGEGLQEIDVNPVIVHDSGCTAVDALVVGRESGTMQNRRSA